MDYTIKIDIKRSCQTVEIFGGVMTENNETLMIESSTLSEWMSADEVCLYDVREEHEFAKSRIPGSTRAAKCDFGNSCSEIEDSRGHEGFKM